MQPFAALEQRAKLISGEASISDDATHRVRVHRIVSRNGQDAGTVSHDDVLSLAEDSEPSLLEGSNRGLVVDARDLRHV